MCYFFKSSQFLNTQCVFWRPDLFVIFSVKLNRTAKAKKFYKHYSLTTVL